MTRAQISFTFDPSDRLLPIQMGFQLCVWFVFQLLFCCLLLLSSEPKTEPRARVSRPQTRSSPPPPSNFVAGRPKVARLVWFFSDFRGGVL